MNNLTRISAIALSGLVFLAGCNLLMPKKKQRGTSVSDPAYKREKASQVRWLPQWQDQSGVAPRFAFWNLLSRCSYQVDYKATVQRSTRPIQIDKRTLSAVPADYAFYSGEKSTKTHVWEGSGVGPVTLWVRKKYTSGMKEQAEWIKTITLAAGSANSLEIASDCKTVAARTDQQPVHQCYKWLYSSACGVRSHRSVGPAPEPEQCTPDSSGVEGDMSKSCEYETPEGMCRVRYGGMARTCLRR